MRSVYLKNTSNSNGVGKDLVNVTVVGNEVPDLLVLKVANFLLIYVVNDSIFDLSIIFAKNIKD